MSTNFPTSLDSHAALVDNTDNIVAAHPNDRGDGIEATQAKVGVDGSAVATAHDYIFTHLPGQVQNWDIGSYEFRSQTLYLDKATGTAPMTITSTTKVSNLNVDQLDGAHASATPSNGIIVIADAQGFLHTPSSAPDADYEVANKKYVDDTLVGGVVQTVNALITTPVDVTATYTADDTAPLYSEGNAIRSLAITPTSASNKLLITADLWGSGNSDNVNFLLYLCDATGSDEALAVRLTDVGLGSHEALAHIEHYVTSGTTNAITFYLMGAVNGNTFYVGRSGAGTNLFGAAQFGSITIKEIKV